MFVFTAGTMLAELARHAPEVLAAVAGGAGGAAQDLEFIRLGAAEIAACPSSASTMRSPSAPTGPRWYRRYRLVGRGQLERAVGAGREGRAGNVAVGDVLLEGAQNCYVRWDGIVTAVVGPRMRSWW